MLKLNPERFAARFMADFALCGGSALIAFGRWYVRVNIFEHLSEAFPKMTLSMVGRTHQLESKTQLVRLVSDCAFHMRWNLLYAYSIGAGI